MMKQFDIAETEKCAVFVKEHGWLLIRNVFSKQEIEDIQAKASIMQTQDSKGANIIEAGNIIII